MIPRNETITSPRVLALTGISERQLHYWADRGHIRQCLNPGAGSGTPKRWPLAVLVDIGRRIALTQVEELLSEAPHE